MAKTLSIYFTGLCYFVNHGDGKTANVVFPNAFREKVAETKDNGDEMIIPSHQVYVRFRRDQVVEFVPPEPNPVVYFTTRDKVDYAAYFLQGEYLEVRVSRDGDQPVSYASTPKTPSDPPSRTDRLPFTKIINLRKDVHQDCGPINDDFVNRPQAGDILGRVDIPWGTLAATFVKRTIEWQFRPDALDPAKRYLAQMVSWDINIADDKAMLAFTSFDGNPDGDHTITLAENGHPLDIEIGNAPIADLLGAGMAHSPDHHFEVYYRLLTRRPAYYLVVPYSDNLSPQGSNCPPVQEKL